VLRRSKPRVACPRSILTAGTSTGIADPGDEKIGKQRTRSHRKKLNDQTRPSVADTGPQHYLSRWKYHTSQELPTSKCTRRCLATAVYSLPRRWFHVRYTRR